jgi:hypothetical protein
VVAQASRRHVELRKVVEVSKTTPGSVNGLRNPRGIVPF